MDSKLKRDIRISEHRAQFDEYAKLLIAHRSVIANIITRVIPEFIGLHPRDVIPLIEEEPSIGKEGVYPGSINPSIIGANTESLIPEEGEVTFDVRFDIWTPGKKDRVKLIVDIEVQKARPSYSISSRGVFYLSRMISMQYGTEFMDSDYDSIKKVYSIWICMDDKKSEEGSMVEFSLRPKVMVGDTSDFGRYDLMGLYLIRLSREVAEKGEGKELHRFLEVLFSAVMRPEEKIRILSEEYDIIEEREKDDIARRASDMCNLSELIWEEALEEGMEKGEEKGASRLGRLMTTLLQDNSIEEAKRAASDEAYRALLYRKYNIN